MSNLPSPLRLPGFASLVAGVLVFLPAVCQCIAAADASTNAASRILAVIPNVATAAFAGANHIALGKFDPVAPTDAMGPGDSVVVLVALHKANGQESQWLLRPLVTGLPATNKGSMTIYNTLGHQFDFPSLPVPVSMRSAGPFVEAKGKPPKIIDDTKKISLDKGHLGLGLDEAAAAVSRMPPRPKRKVPFRSGTSRFSEEEIAATREHGEELNLTTAQERALGGSFPALLSYFGIVQQSDNLSSILFEVVDRPSVFSLVANLGVSSVQFNWHGARRSSSKASAWGLTEDLPIYEIPMTLHLNNHPSL
ncbi:MAG TPA: hypothetical protein VHH73_09600, partial [Verrucomicrobiae bacterium]|nr:hypothetical protein [Verrucomicrobiae bacterium]